MSRAFVFDNSDWSFCIDKHESCMFANPAGGCSLNACRQYPEKPKAEQKETARVGQALDKN